MPLQKKIVVTSLTISDIIKIVKKKIAMAVILITCLTLAVPSLGYSRRYYRGCYGGCGHYRSGDYWVPAAVMAGSILVGALIVGAIAQNSRQQNAARQTSYGTIYQGQPYASPDPDFVAKHGNGRTQTPGEWIIVPGQQVGGTYVPAHRVFVPNR